VMPSPVPEPGWVAQNFKLGQDLGLPDVWLNGQQGLAVFSGNGLWEGMEPRASVYSGTSLGNGPVNWAMAAH